MLSRKYFNRMAEILAQNRPEKGSKEFEFWRRLVGDLADFFYEDNWRFNRDRFYTACSEWGD